VTQGTAHPVVASQCSPRALLAGSIERGYGKGEGAPLFRASRSSYGASGRKHRTSTFCLNKIRHWSFKGLRKADSFIFQLAAVCFI